MSIASNSLITWSDFSSTCLNAIKSVCCNVDGFASDVPERLKSGQTQAAVQTMTTTVSAGGTAQTYTWYANPENLITTTTSATIESEWTVFLAAAGVDARSSAIIQANDMVNAVSLYMQFMAYHIKPIYSRRQVYNTTESQTLYQGCKYVGGTCTPDYTLSPISPSSIPTVTDSDITTAISRSVQANRLFTHYDNPVNHRCYLS